MATPVTKIPGTFPAGFCPNSPQEFYNEIMRISSWEIATAFTGVIKSSVQPDADNTDKVWFRLNPDQSPDRHYVYYNGTWVWPHEVPAGSKELRAYYGNLTELNTYDGGDTNAASDLSGPMWEVATDYEGRMLIAAGSLPGSGNVLSLGDEGGSDQTTIEKANLPEEGIDIKINRTTADDTATGAITGGGATATPQPPPENNVQTLTSEDMGDGDAMTTISPYKAVYFIQRTSRKYYTI